MQYMVFDWITLDRKVLNVFCRVFQIVTACQFGMVTKMDLPLLYLIGNLPVWSE